MLFSWDSPMCWHHSLILGLNMWRLTTTTHDLYSQYYHIWPIKVNLYTYFFVFMHDRTPRTLLLSLSHLNIPANKIILLKQSSQGNLHLGYFLTWERPLDASSGISPRYSSATSSKLTISSHYRYNAGWVIMNSFPKAPTGRGGLSVTLGVPGHLSIAESFSCCLCNPFRALLPH